MSRPEETHPNVIGFAMAMTTLRRERKLTPLETMVAVKLALEVVVEESEVVAAPFHALRQMLDEVERKHCPETFPHRIEPYPIERWKTTKTATKTA